MGIYAHGKGFQAKVMVKGTRHTGTFVTRQEAEAWEADVRAAAARGQPIPSPLAGTTRAARIQDIEGLYDRAVSMHWSSKKAGKALARNARIFVDWVGPRTPVEAALHMDTIHKYVTHRMGVARNSNGTVNRHLSAISVLANELAVPLGLLPGRIRMPWRVQGEARLRYFTTDEENALVNLTRTWDAHDYADLWVWLVDTGARLGETRKLEWEDIRGNRVTFHASITKNGKTRTITATPRVMALIARLKARHHNELRGPFQWVKDRPLRSLWDRLRSRFDWMDEHTVIHTFRHTCASRLAMDGASEVQIMRWMGHTSSATTQRYMHLSPTTMDDLADRLTRQAPQGTQTVASAP